MAKLPDHIDKNDKYAVAEYFIQQRKYKEYKSHIDELIEREGNGYTIKLVEHITWRIWPPPTEKTDENV